MKKLIVHSTFTLFQDDNKSDRELIVQPMVDEFKSLEEGFETAWSSKTKVKYTAFVADAVCRASIINVQGHNGTFPCHRCKIKFIKMINQEKKIFPVITSNQIDFKTHDYHLACIKMLLEIQQEGKTAEHVHGIKGTTPLLQLNGFNIVEDVIFDIMHCGFLGIYRHLIESYLTNTDLNCFEYVNNKKPSKSKILELIDNEIVKIKHPSCLSRKLRSFKEQKHFKCSEYQNILFSFAFSFLNRY